MASLREKAVEGTKWSAAGQLITVGLNVLQLVVLARLLRPEDFGLLAMGMVVVGFAQVFTDMGLSNAIIHRLDSTPLQLSSLYWANVLAGGLCFVAVWASAPIVATFFNEPAIGGLMFWLGLSVFISSVGQQFGVLLQKELRFQILATIQVSSAIVGTTAAITAALLEQGIYALVWGLLSQGAAMSLARVAIGLRFWCPQLHFRGEDLRQYLSFGMYQMGERTVNYYASNIDNLLIGRFLGPEALGVYSIAYRLIITPVRNINPVLTKVAFPILARKQDDDAALRRGYLELIRLLSFFILPALIGLAVAAPLVVPMLFGERWRPAIPIVQLLAIVGIMRGLGNPVGSILLAKGRADIGFKWNLIVAAVNSVVFFIAVQLSLVALALAYVVVSILYWLGVRLLLKRAIGLGWSEYLRALAVPFLCASIMGGAVLIFYQTALHRGWSDMMALSAIIAIGVLTYTLLALAFARQYLRELTAMFINRKPGKI